MKRNQTKLIVIEILVVLFVIGLVGTTSWIIYSKTAMQQNSSINRPPNTYPKQNNSSEKNPASNVMPVDYPKPTAPRDLKVTPLGNGYQLTWERSVANSTVAKYQIFYQGSLLTEVGGTNYQHNLPPPLPSCNSVTLTYYVQAVDNTGVIGQPSNSVTVKYGGCP